LPKNRRVEKENPIMARFLIEVPHGAEAKECALAVKVLLSSGSHYLTNAEFGCLDGDHTAWIIVEADSREEVKFVIPPAYRPQAKIVKLNKFSLAEMDELLKCHPE
jgi:hypothetical protein